MRQLKTIEQLQKLFPQVQGVDIALLIGSFARGDANPNSDIDIQLLVNDEFQPKCLKNELQKAFQKDIQFVSEVSMRNKIVVHFIHQPKVDIALFKEISEINRNYLGSEISNIAKTILYERQPAKYDISTYLRQLVENNSCIKTSQKDKMLINGLIDKFLYEFENCSTMHRRSDSYQFYFFYNIALQVAIQLKHLKKGHRKFNFLPKYFTANVLEREELEPYYQLKGTLFLPEANQQKRKLLDFFYSAIETNTPTERQIEVTQFCEWVYNRDFFWNFRDISKHNPNIKSGKIFRTATLSLFQNETRFDELLNEKQIKTVIDLRADNEVNDLPYSPTTLTKFKYVRAPFDPWNQPDWFIQNHHQGTNEEIAYRFFGIGCNDKIKTIMEAIVNEDSGSTAIHCFAGKDRTGIFISLLHLLVGASIETVYADYLASEVDVRVYRLNIVLDIVREKGGIEPYLLWCGLTENQIAKLQRKLINE